jgi:hypothetical protein
LETGGSVLLLEDEDEHDDEEDLANREVKRFQIFMWVAS